MTTQKKPLSRRAATRIVRAWAEQRRPLRWTVDNLCSYGTDDVARAIRVLGADDAWAICETVAPARDDLCPVAVTL